MNSRTSEVLVKGGNLLKKYVVKRLALGLFTIILTFVLTFFLIRLAPGDPIKLLAGRENPNQQMIEKIRMEYGLNHPLHIQFWHYLRNLLRGDLGFSYKNNVSVWSILSSRLKPTLILTLSSTILSALIGTALGIYSVRKDNRTLDRTLINISYFIDAIPSYWLGMVLIIIFASLLGWFPTSGMQNVRMRYTGMRRALDIGYHMVLPVLTIVIIQVPIYFRVVRTSILNVIGDDYIQLFRAAGMQDNHIFNRYVLKNAASPVIVLFGSSLAFTLSGVSLIEIIFGWPGMGRLIIDSINVRDYMVLNGIYLIISISVIIFMILIDIVQAMVDPRIRMR